MRSNRWIALAAWLCLAALWTQALQAKDVPYVPTPEDMVEEMLQLAAVTPEDTVYDLGCGDGRIVVAAARQGARGVGVDIDPDRIRESLRSADQAGVTERTRFIEGDLFQAEIKPASVVTLYLLSSVNLRLRPRLLAELAPGTRVVSQTFTMADWRPDRTSQRFASPIFLWIIPANASGDWAWSLGDAPQEAWTMRLSQKFQEVDGSLAAGNAVLQPKNLKLTGERIAFEVDRTVGGRTRTLAFEGRVRGDEITGTARQIGGDASLPWRATRRAGTARPLDDAPVGQIGAAGSIRPAGAKQP